jgi:hypothetical protein
MFKALHLDNVRRLFCPISTSPSQITIMSIRVGFVMCRELRMIIFYQCLTPVPSMTEKETPPKESHADRTARRSPASCSMVFARGSRVEQKYSSGIRRVTPLRLLYAAHRSWRHLSVLRFGQYMGSSGRYDDAAASMQHNFAFQVMLSRGRGRACGLVVVP